MAENPWLKGDKVPPNFHKEKVGARCQKIANSTLLQLVRHVNTWPVEEDEKLTAVLTICQEMLEGCLDGIYKGRLSTPDKLSKKLEFLKIMRSHWIRNAAAEAAQEKDHDA